MAVTIDIPGIGSVEARNAASESTLKELLKAMQGVEKKISGKKGKKSGGAEDEDDVKTPATELGKELAKLSKAVMPVIGGFKAVGNAMTGIANIIGDFANVGDSIERAAQQIPIFGGMLSTVASASVKVNDALLSASKSGAGFGDSITEFARSASEAGMTLSDFGNLIRQNGEGMLGFGASTDEGARRFSQVSKALRQSAGDLYALGYSTQEINQGLASYGDLLRKQGLQGTKTNAELAAGAKNYMKEIDALAKITGEERSVKEAQMKALATDVQFQMSMAGKSAETRESFMKLIGGFGPTLGGFVKDYVANGTATSEANAKIAAALGGPTMDELTKLRAKLQRNEQLSVEEQDRLRAIIKKAADVGAKQLGTSIAASGGALDDMGKAFIEGSQIQIGAVKQTAEEQRKAALEGSGFNKKMQEIQQRLAEFSNGFQIALARSGVLDFLMNAFSVMATLVQTFVVPAFKLIGDLLPGIATALGVYLVAMLAANAATIANTVAKGINTAMMALQNAPMMMFALAVGGLVLLFKKLGGDSQVLMDSLKVLGSYFTEFGQNLALLYYKLMDKITPGDKYKKLAEEQELKIEQTKNEREELKKGIADRAKANRAANAQDAKNLDEKKKIDAEKNKLDYNSGPEELLKQFAKAEGSPLIPKAEAAKKELEAKNEAVPKEKSRESIPKAEAAKKELEAKGEEKAKAEEKAKTEAQKQKEIEERSAADKGKAPATIPAAQESAESLLSNLNTKMDQLIKLSAQTTTNTYQQVVATRGLSQDLFTSLPS